MFLDFYLTLFSKLNNFFPLFSRETVAGGVCSAATIACILFMHAFYAFLVASKTNYSRPLFISTQMPQRYFVDITGTVITKFCHFFQKYFT